MKPAEITPALLLAAYAKGYFPMAEHREAEEIHWFYPETRGILPLAEFHIPRSLAKTYRKTPWRFSTNAAFAEVMHGCAAREDTWINDTIIALYCDLHTRGFAHSVEVWDEQQTLIGGLYGVALGGAFFGESMFSRAPNASKLALLKLVELLNGAGYTLLDAQYVNQHLTQFGIVEIPREEYLHKLNNALAVTPVPCF